MPNFRSGAVAVGLTPGPQGPPATNPLTTEGDLLYQHSGVQAALPIGTESNVLVSTGTDPQWQPAGNVAVGSLNTLQGAVVVVSTSELKINTGAPSGQDIQVTGNGLSVTIATAALTALGTQGSMVFTRGILTAQTPAT